MASLENLPPDQRAVLQMVLGRGRTYDQIAEVLKLDPADVRRRALSALDTLGPGTRVPAERRALITDYLLGQLSERSSDEVRDQLARSPSERAWARVVASELQSLTDGDLPEIPAAATPGDRGRRRTSERAPASAAPVAASAGRAAAAEAEPPSPSSSGPRAVSLPSSRRGGAILLGIGAIVVIGVLVVVIVNSGGGSSHKSTPPTTATNASTTPASTSTSTTASGCNPATSTTACVIHQVNLLNPSGSKSTVGIADVLRKGGTTAIAIVATGVPANTKHDAYAVWLANSATSALRLGFVNPGVGKNGRLQTAGGLPKTASRYKELLITLETHANPSTPGTIVLEGQFAE